MAVVAAAAAVAAAAPVPASHLATNLTRPISVEAVVTVVPSLPSSLVYLSVLLCSLFTVPLLSLSLSPRLSLSLSHTIRSNPAAAPASQPFNSNQFTLARASTPRVSSSARLNLNRAPPSQPLSHPNCIAAARGIPRRASILPCSLLLILPRHPCPPIPLEPTPTTSDNGKLPFRPHGTLANRLNN